FVHLVLSGKRPPRFARARDLVSVVCSRAKNGPDASGEPATSYRSFPPERKTAPTLRGNPRPLISHLLLSEKRPRRFGGTRDLLTDEYCRAGNGPDASGGPPHT